MHYSCIKFPGIVLLFSLAQAVCAQPDTSVSYSSTMPDTLVKEEENSFATVEAVSYQLYLDQKWEELAVYGEKVIKEGSDYYYLRVRLGTAYFELKQYRRAIPHFEKAREFSAGEDYANKYLYAAYLYAERYEDAKWLSKTFSSSLAASLKSKDLSPIDFVVAEGGFKTCDSSRLFKNPYFTNLGLSHSLEKRLFLFHNLSFFKQGEARFAVDQFQYYLKASLPLKKGMLLSGGFHFVHLNSDIRTVEQSVYSYTYEIPGGPGFPPVPPPRTVSVSTVVNTDKMTNKKSNNFIGSAAVLKHFSFVDLSLGVTSASFDSTFQNQLNAGLYLYPLGNNLVSLGTNIYFHKEDKTDVHVAVAPYVSVYPSPKVNLCANYLYNEGPNITEGNGYFVSNSIDYTLHRISLTTSLKINTMIWLYGTYGYEIKKHLTLAYHYNYHIFALGLKVIPKYK